ncbi:hypothetical protein MKO06_01620 [Gramella sp. GC03-9]|uniref:DUF1772 domain-containing protein n=1 Tax=Christiangramia oceanisediminis TaxID=2920386 RepID=A0A9X2KX87_9FLAO|nr:hypothetical protein [Gramella oceanisediminis]MCP9198586.1 hypothetical protein [Gramella oceanisediminis]
MDLLSIRLLLDFGLMVLIWTVQLVIYPGLCHYRQEELGKWHSIYTQRIGVIVGPLMIAQLAVCILQLWQEKNLYTWGSLVIILLTWILTFLIFVPLHNSISPDKPCEEITNSLVIKNWWRTWLWSVLFLGSLGLMITDYNF